MSSNSQAKAQSQELHPGFLGGQQGTQVKPPPATSQGATVESQSWEQSQAPSPSILVRDVNVPAVILTAVSNT